MGNEKSVIIASLVILLIGGGFYASSTEHGITGYFSFSKFFQPQGSMPAENIYINPAIDESYYQEPTTSIQPKVSMSEDGEGLNFVILNENSINRLIDLQSRLSILLENGVKEGMGITDPVIANIIDPSSLDRFEEEVLGDNGNPPIRPDETQSSCTRRKLACDLGVCFSTTYGTDDVGKSTEALSVDSNQLCNSENSKCGCKCAPGFVKPNEKQAKTYFDGSDACQACPAKENPRIFTVAGSGSGYNCANAQNQAKNSCKTQLNAYSTKNLLNVFSECPDCKPKVQKSGCELAKNCQETNEQLTKYVDGQEVETPTGKIVYSSTSEGQVAIVCG